RNSPLPRVRSTPATASTGPLAVAYSTRRSRTRSRASGYEPGPVIGSSIGSLISRTSPGERRGPPGSGPGPEAGAGPGTAARAELALLAHGPQRRVADLVEGVVHQGEGDADDGDAQGRQNGPPSGAGLQRGLRVGPVEHGAPAVGVRVAQAQELQAGRGEHGVQGGAEEVGDDQGDHRRQHLEDDDI